MQSKQARHKGRQSLSCLNCKARKVKCDRNKPICSACLKNRIPAHLCVYQDSFPNPSKQTSVREVNFSLVDGIGNTSQVDGTTIDIHDFTYIKINGDFRLLFGPTCYKTILKEAVKGFPVIFDIFSKSYEDIAKLFSKVVINRPINIISIDIALRKLPDLLPSYKDCLTILSVFLQTPGMLFRCFNGNTVLEYFNEVFERNPSSKRVMIRKTFSKVRLSVIVSIIALSSFSYNKFKVNSLELLSISKSLLYDTDLKSTLPTFLSLILLYEARKYDFNIDFEEALSHDQALLSNIVVIGSSLGLGRSEEKVHGSGDADFIRSLKHAWIYVYFEDTLRSFQKGQQPLLAKEYLLKCDPDDEVYEYELKISVLRDINDKLNSNVQSRNVNVNEILDDLEGLLSKEDFGSLNDEDKYFQLIVLSYIQAMNQIRYLKRKNDTNRNEAFKYSLLLFVAATHFMNSTVIDGHGDSESPLCSTPYYHEIKEALFRSSFFIIPSVLCQVERTGHSVPVKQQLYKELTFATVEELIRSPPEQVSIVYGDVFWMLNVITNDLQSMLSKLSVASFSSRTMFIFTNNILSYVMGVLENANSASPTIDNQTPTTDPSDDISTEFTIPQFDVTSFSKEDFWDFFL
ncbi:uncharacterized protein RJT21DRAFT_18275 [Scheffersomyces amazonensis]|uniref:uncharacterized protein n=1 Tax=Scheffersomyces amazonensis TaxID=1078765 RepID=UPI00315D79A5